MKRKFDFNNNSYNPPLKRRKIETLSLLIEKQEKQFNLILEKINNLDNRINNVDKRLKDVENFIEENTPRKPTFSKPPSYIY